MATSNDPAPVRRGNVRRLILSSLWLSSPVWGLVLMLGLLSFSHTAARLPGEPFLAFATVAPFVGAIPIFRLAVKYPVKTVAFVAYYLGCLVAMFISGWAALGMFGIVE